MPTSYLESKLTEYVNECHPVAGRVGHKYGRKCTYVIKLEMNPHRDTRTGGDNMTSLE